MPDLSYLLENTLHMAKTIVEDAFPKHHGEPDMSKPVNIL